MTMPLIELMEAGRAEQRKQIERVSDAIARHVVDFCRARLEARTPEFYMSELTAFVASRVLTAPDSAGRILRDLRRRGVVSYEVVSRGESLYRVKAA